MKVSSFFLSLFFSALSIAQTGSSNLYDEVSRKIGLGDCSGADAIARSSFQEPMIYTVLGIIQLDCRKNKKGAIDYFMLSARQNESLAIDKMISLGEKLPSLNQESRTKNIIINPPLPTPPPMPTIIQTAPVKIFITPQNNFQPISNPNACIQDGGPIFCPNHPNTRR